MNNYCIRDDYKSRPQANTYVDDAEDYWTQTRIATSGIYQYHVYKWAAKLAREMDQCSLADIGCGYPNKINELILPVTKNVTLVDQPSVERLLETRFPQMNFIPLNLEMTGISLDAKFDCVVCADVIEHLMDPDPLLAFIHRILAPDGLAVISTPNRDIERGSNCLNSPHPEHVREWNFLEFAKYLSISGFDVLEHSNLPKGRLSWIEETMLPLARLLKITRYNGCQTAICKLSNTQARGSGASS